MEFLGFKVSKHFLFLFTFLKANMAEKGLVTGNVDFPFWVDIVSCLQVQANKATCNYGTMKYQWLRRFQCRLHWYIIECTQLTVVQYHQVHSSPVTGEPTTPQPITSDRGGGTKVSRPVSSKPTGRGASGLVSPCDIR